MSRSQKMRDLGPMALLMSEDQDPRLPPVVNTADVDRFQSLLAHPLKSQAQRFEEGLAEIDTEAASSPADSDERKLIQLSECLSRPQNSESSQGVKPQAVDIKPEIFTNAVVSVLQTQDGIRFDFILPDPAERLWLLAHAESLASRISRIVHRPIEVRVLATLAGDIPHSGESEVAD
jgi:hypothetical protein